MARTSNVPNEPEPRWQVLIAVLAVGGLEVSLPPQLTAGPRWLFPALVGVLLVPLVLSHRQRLHRLNMTLGMIVTSLMTLAMVVSLGLLIRGLLAHAEGPGELLMSAAALWSTNVLVFSLWVLAPGRRRAAPA